MDPNLIPEETTNSEESLLHGKTSPFNEEEKDIPVESTSVSDVPVIETKKEKPQDRAEFFEADAFNILNTSTDLFSGYEQLSQKYNEKTWDDPQKANQVLIDYGKKLRQKLKVPGLSDQDTYDLSPIKPDEIASDFDDPIENRLDRVEQWKNKNLDVLNTTKDPDLLISKDLLERSIKYTALTAEQNIRKEYRDEHWYRFGFLKDKAARFAQAAVNPIQKLITGEENTDLRGYQDPTRDTSVVSNFASLAGTVTGFAVPAAPLMAVGASAGLAYGAANLLGAAGEVRGRYEFVEEETGDPARAAKAATLEGIAQGIYAVPFVSLGSKATTTIKEFLKEGGENVAKEMFEAVPGKLASIRKEATKGALQGAISGGAGTVVSNQSLKVGLDNNDASIFDGVAESIMYGGAFGGMLGGIHGLGTRQEVINKNLNALRDVFVKEEAPVNPVDTALHAVAAEEKGSKNDFNRVFKESLPQEPEAEAPVTETQKATDYASTMYRDPKDVVFNEDAGNTNKTGKKIVTNEDGSVDVHDAPDQTTVPKEILEAKLSKPEFEGVHEDAPPEGADVDAESFFKSTNINSEDPQNPNFKNFYVGTSKEKTRQDLKLAGNPLRIMKSLIGNLGDKEGLDTYVKWLRNNIGVRGYFNPGTQKVYVPKHLFTSPLEAEQTLLHELGHWVDYMNDYINDASVPETYKTFLNKGLIEKLATAKNDLPALVAGERRPQILAQAKELSRIWRDGWEKGDTTSDYGKYRNDPKEIFADVFSAMFMRPDLVKNYKALYRLIDKGWSENPAISETYSWLKRAYDNPFVLEELATAQKKSAYLKTYDVEQASRKGKEAEKTERRKQLPKQAITSLYTNIFNKYKAAYDIVTKLPRDIKERGYELLHFIKAPSYLRDMMERNFHQPIRAMLGYVENILPDIEVNLADGTKLKGPKLSDFLADTANLMRAIKIKEETTPVMDRIQQDPMRYMSYVQTFFLQEGPKVPYNLKLYGIRDLLSESYKSQLREAISKRDVGMFTDLMARLKSEIRVSRIPKKLDKGKVADKSSDRAFDFQGTHPSEKEVNRRLRASRRISKVFGNIAEDILSDTSFNVRRYLVNETGENILDANSTITYLKHKYGENYKLLEDFNKTYYEVISSTHDVIEQSGLLPPDLMERFKLNKDSYVTNLVLKHFTGFGDMDSKLKAAVGSLSETGDPLSGTLGKMEPLTVAAYMQLAENSKIALAKFGGYEVEKVKVPFGKTPWEYRDKLNKETVNDHYAILAVEGKKHLIKITDGHDFQYFNKNPFENPVTNFLGNTFESLNKMFLIKDLRTRLSPVFYLSQKVLDRFNETLQVMQAKGSANPISAFKEVLDINKKTSEMLSDFKKGITKKEISEAFKANISTNPMSYWLEHAKDPDTAIEALAKAWGKPLEKPVDAIDKLHQKASEKMDKLFIGKPIKKGLSILERAIETDEMRTKLNGYFIGLRFGMGKAEAAHFAINNFGIPDPRGGGVQAPLINKFFLFGRAYLNGLRVAGNLITKNKKNAAAIFLTTIALPKLLVSSAAPQLLGSVFGEDFEKTYAKFLEKLPTFEKEGKVVFPIGFTDEEGNLKHFGEVSADQIGYNWKAAYIRIPQDRALTDVTRATWPIIEEVLKGATGQGGNVQKGVQNSFAGTFFGMSGRLNPAAQMIYNIGQYALGYNPTDLFRGKPVIPKDIFLGGSQLDKAGSFGKYAGSQILPNFMPYNAYNLDSPKNIYEYIQKVPAAGPLTRSFFGVTNYGQVEKAKEMQFDNEVDRATVRFNMDDISKSVYNKYRAAKSSVLSYGAKEMKERLTPQESVEYTLLHKWGAKFSEYSKYIRLAEDRGDKEQAEYFKKQLEKLSAQVDTRIKEIYTKTEE